MRTVLSLGTSKVARPSCDVKVCGTTTDGGIDCTGAPGVCTMVARPSADSSITPDELATPLRSSARPAARTQAL